MTTNSHERKSKLSTHVFYLALLMIVSGYALGLSGNQQPERDGFFQRIGNWLGIAGMFFETPPEEKQPEAELQKRRVYQAMPEELVNKPVTRSMGSDGHPVIEHGSGW